MTTPQWFYNIESLVTGLLTLEINTVQKQGISAQKMPALPVALHDIADAYDVFLGDCKYGVTQRLLGLAAEHLAALRGKQDETIDDGEIRGWHPKQEPIDRRDVKIDELSFEALRWAAEACLRDANDLGLAPEIRAVLVRVRTNCRQLGRAVLTLRKRWAGQEALSLLDGTIDDVRQKLLDKPDMVVPVDSDIIVLVRKMWDLGTATVLMQTSIQIDGDAANFLSPSLTDDRHSFALVAHQRVIDTALAQWRTLFQLAASLVKDLAGAIRT